MTDIAKLPTDFEVMQQYACLHLSGKYSFRKTIGLVKDAIRYSREQKIPKLLVDAAGVWGFASPSFIERFWMGEEIAEEATGAVIIAFVASPDFIDPEKFGATIAQNKGLVADVFRTTDEAKRWLAAL